MTTIAVALPAELSEAQKDQAKTVASEFGYGLSFDLARAEADVRDGLRQAAERLPWRTFLLFHARMSDEIQNADYDAALASRIQEELLQFELSGAEPPFFEFLARLDAVLDERVESYWVIFADEWRADERIRLEAGSLSQLFSRLRQPANWQQRLWVVAIGETQDSDEVPLVFHVHR